MDITQHHGSRAASAALLAFAMLLAVLGPPVVGTRDALAATAGETAMSLECRPSGGPAGQASTCTVAVTDLSESPSAPTGPVTFATSATGTFTATECDLASTGPFSGACEVTYTPTSGTSHVITASYGTASARTVVSINSACSGFTASLEGLDANPTQWQSNNLQDWKELEYIPARVKVCGSGGSAQLVTVEFSHHKVTGGNFRPGIQNLFDFEASPNLTITDPVLIQSGTNEVWKYQFTVTLTGTGPQAGVVDFTARMSAGAHNFTGSSLHLGGTPSLGTMQIHKPAAAPGAPDLAVTKTGPATAPAGSQMTYTIDYENLSNDEAGTGVQLVDTLPAGVTFVGCDSGCTHSGGLVTWDLGSIGPGDDGTVTVTVLIGSDQTGNTLINTAELFLAQNDANPANNRDTHSTLVTDPQSAVISGTVYNDANGDGSPSAGETGLPGVTVNLAGSATTTASTDGDGSYSFVDLAAGSYTVTYTVPDGFANTGGTAHDVTLATAQTSGGNDFFARRQTTTELARTAGSEPSTYGDPVTFTATVESTKSDAVQADHPGTGEGTVTFWNGGPATGEALCTDVALGAAGLATNTATCTIANLPVGTYSITAVYSGITTGRGFAGSDSEDVGSVVTQTVTTAPLSVVADNQSREYGLANPTLSGTLTGVVAGDDITATYTTTAGVSSPVGTYPITAAAIADAAVLANYTVTETDGTLSVIKAPLSVTADDKSREYGQPNPTLTGVVDGVRNDDDITGSYSTAAVAASPVGTYPIIAAAVADAAVLANYAVSLTDGTLTVTEATVGLVATAADKSREYGLANPTLTGTLTGVVAGDDITALYSTTATSASDVGDYAITVTLHDPDGRLDNYASVQINHGTLSVTKAPLTVTPDGKSREYGLANPALTGVVDGVRNNDDITATYVTAATVTSPVGDYDIDVDEVADPGGRLGNYAVTLEQGTLTITQSTVPLVVSTDDKSREYGLANPELTGGITGVRAGDDLSGAWSTMATAASDVGGYEITASLVDPDNRAGNYETITLDHGTLTITKATLTVSADDAEREVGEADPDFTVTYSGFVLDQTLATSDVTGAPACTSEATADSPPSAYPITCTAGTLQSTNYQFAFEPGTLTIGETVVLPGVIDVIRLSGPTRIETAIEVSRDSYPDGGAGAVVIARADLFPDALAGTPLAVKLDAPLLLTQPYAMPMGTQEELQRVLSPGGTVVLLGGSVAIHPEVEAHINDLGYPTVRYGGIDRFETATIIADQGLDNPGTLFVASGIVFPDALAAGAAGGVIDGGVLLTHDGLLPEVTEAYIDANPEAARFAVGGPAVRADSGATALSGATRFETALAVAERFFPEPEVIGVATGHDFPDALTGGVHIAKRGGPMILSASDSLPPSVQGYLEAQREQLRTVYLYGGTVALSDAVEEAIKAILVIAV